MNLHLETSREVAFGPATVTIDLVTDQQLPYPVRWSFIDVSAGPASCVFDYEVDTVGSDSPFYQSLRFGARDMLLRAFRFSVPDHGLPLELATGWLDAPQVRALPRLRAKQSFALDRVDGRIFLPNGGHLLGLLDNADAGKERISVRIAEDFSLLFSAGRYVGWVLERAITHLISPEQADPLPMDYDDDVHVVSLFCEYFDLIDDSSMERMAEGDPLVEEALVSLIRRVGDDPIRHGPKFALRRQLLHMAASFYG